MSVRCCSDIALRTLVLCASLFLLASCSVIPERDAGKAYVWPAAPEVPRITYQATLGWEDDLRSESASSRLRAFALGAEESAKKILRKPFDVAALGGRVVVTDTLDRRAYVWDIPRRSLFAIGWRREGRLGKPLGVALDRKQNIYVVDGAQNRVVKYDHLGLFQAFIGEADRFSRLSDVAVADDGTLFLLDRGGVESDRHRIAVYSPGGEFQRFIGERGHEPGKFNHPAQLVIAGDGDLYVLDAGNFRVQVFTQGGELVRHWGKLGRTIGDLARPRGLAVSSRGEVLVTDSAFQNVQIFSREGALLMQIGGPDAGKAPGNYVLPAGVSVDEAGYIYIVDQALRHIEVLKFLADE